MSQLTLSNLHPPRALGYAALAASLVCAPIAAHAASATANSTITILAPVTITKTADLVFGTVAPAATAGTVTMSPADARSATGAVDLSQTVAGNSAKFNLTGNANSTFSVTLPSSTSLTGPGTAMTLNAFTSTPSATGSFIVAAPLRWPSVVPWPLVLIKRREVIPVALVSRLTITNRSVEHQAEAILQTADL